MSIWLGLQASNKTVKIDAYVVDKLNPLHMAGASKFAKKLQAKGVDLADWRLINQKCDTVDFDVW